MKADTGHECREAEPANTVLWRWLLVTVVPGDSFGQCFYWLLSDSYICTWGQRWERHGGWNRGAREFLLIQPYTSPQCSLQWLAPGFGGHFTYHVGSTADRNISELLFFYTDWCYTSAMVSFVSAWPGCRTQLSFNPHPRTFLHLLYF